MRLFAFAVVVLSLTSSAPAEDWRQFRGGSAGKLEKIRHPLTWGAGQNIAWKAPMTGSGWSSPVVVGDRVFLTSAESDSGARPKGMMAGVASMATFRNAKPSKHRFVVTCLSLSDGKQQWTRTAGESTPRAVHPSNTYATESPATDGERLFSFFATTGSLVAWDFNGEELWRKELGAYKSGNGFGTGSSLAVFDGSVFVQYDNEERSFVAAFKAEDGTQIWRDDRSTKTSWSTPQLWQNAGRTELVTCGSGVVTSYDPASGDVLWRLRGIKSAFSASPTFDQQRIYFGNSGPMSAGPLVAVKSGTRGEIQLDNNFKAAELAWSRTKSGPGMASPVVAKEHIYIPGRGIMNCYDARSGERVYRERVAKMATVASSLWADEDRLFMLDEKGTTFVFQTGPEFRLLETNKIDDLFWSTPAIAGNSLLLRGVEHLYCIRQ